MNNWKDLYWGDLITLEYGKPCPNYADNIGEYPVFGTNGKIGQSKKALCNHPSVIIGRKGAYRGVHYSDKPFWVIDTAFYLEPKVDIDLKWAYYNLLTQDINGMDSGSAIPSTSRQDFYFLSVKLPPLSEQKAIAHILSSFDDKIELNRQMNETLEAMARAIFKSWFVDFDPVSAKRSGRQPAGMDTATADLFPDEFEESSLGLIPKGWELKSLDEIANFLNGLALQKYPPNSEEYLPVIKIAELRKGITEQSAKASIDIPSDYIVENGDILFSWSGSLVNCIWCGGKGALNQHLFKVTSTKYPKWFYYQWVNYHLPEFQFIAASKATTMGHIQRHHLKEAKVITPSFTLLSSMDKIMNPLFEQVINSNLESHTLATLRDTLLPKLMSGEIRVKEAEKIINDKL